MDRGRELVKLKSGLFSLLVLAVAGYGGAKYYVHTKVKDKLDELVRMASPFAEIRYGEITSDLRGSLKIEDIGLNAAEGTALQIGNVELEGPDPRFLWDLTNGFKNSEPPEKLALRLMGISIPADQNFKGDFGPITLGGKSTGSGQVQPCTLSGLLKHAGLEQIGMETLSANSTMGYSLNRASGEAWVFLDYELEGIESLSLAMSLRGIPESGALVMGAMPRFADIDISYSLQAGHIKRLVGHCASQSQQSSDQFLQAVFTQSDRDIAENLGFVPGPGIKEMLRKLITNGGTVQLVANPADGLEMATLLAHKPEEIMRLLKVKLSLDEKPVEDLSIAFANNGAALSGPWGLNGLGADAGESSEEELKDDVEAADSEVRIERLRMRYVETGISDLQHYLGSRVKLYTRDSGKPKQGYLASYKGDIFSVEQNIHGGTMTAHVRVSEISKAEVLRPVP